MTTQMSVMFKPDPEGIKAAIESLERLLEPGGVAQEGSDGKAPESGAARRPNPAVALYEATGEDSVTRRLLRLLPGERSEAMTPAEIAAALGPKEDGTALSKASARAAILNARRIEKRLRAEGVIDREVIRADFEGYDAEHAGRYYLRLEDSAVIEHLAQSAASERRASEALVEVDRESGPRGGIEV